MSVKVKLPDGNVLSFDNEPTILEIAGSIGEGLARASLAGKVDGTLKGLDHKITTDCELKIITFKDAEGKDLYRHTTSHIMAQAIKRLFKDVKFGIGPSIENGFYYDFDIKDKKFTPEDFEAIEAEMKKIIKEKIPIVREELSKEDAIKLFSDMGEKYKVELINELDASMGPISIYKQGDFVDLCRGPHLPDTGYIKAFALMSIAGAYWRGDEKNAMLQRIYGTAFTDKKDLKEYLDMLEEAKKRDHRKLGKELDLFSFQDEGPGFPFFHNKGQVIYLKLIEFCREENRKRGYQEISTPIILNEDLWHRSGHWDHYKENMYFTVIDEKDFAVKPMNCPGGLLAYKTNLHSYKEFPLKVGEFGRVHRHEMSGVLHGLFRVRTFTQDDAHVFCTPDQIEEEIINIIELIFHIYKTVGFKDFHIELSTRPAKSTGSDEMWEKATNALKVALERLKINYQLNPGDGAFYGPKIDFHIKDCLNRSWQCGTIQVDFSMPERFELEYIDNNGERKCPVMIHRAILGSIERFLGILIEHYAGNFPLWLAPAQVAVLTISANNVDYGKKVVQKFRENGFFVEEDFRDESIKKKIRDVEMQKVPCMLILGDKETENNTVSLRRHTKGDVGSFDLDELVNMLKKEVEDKINY